MTANDDGTFNVVGDKPQRWVMQTDFANAEAIGYLADRLASYGVEKELFKKGAKAGDEVRIGIGDEAVIFDWEPSIEVRMIGSCALAIEAGSNPNKTAMTSRNFFMCLLPGLLCRLQCGDEAFG